MTALSPQDYIRHDATALASLVRERQVAPSELIEAALEQLATVNSDLGAVVRTFVEMATPTPDRSANNGPFAGVPFLLKDLFSDLKGTVSENGSDFHVNEPADRDATVVSRYKRAGLRIFGKTHSPEFGGTSTTESRRFGQTRNPYSHTLSAGGSSGGAAAAVASGIVPAAQATDAGGSIVIPASCCGLFGLKPSRGRVPLGPVRYQGAGGLATQHVLTRTVRDSAAFLDVEIAKEDASHGWPVPAFEVFSAALRRPLPRLKIASMPISIEGIEPDRECLAAHDSAVSLCRTLGHVVEQSSPDIDVARYLRAERIIRLSSVAATIKALEAQIGRPAHKTDLEPATWERYRIGLEISGSDVLEAREAIFMICEQIHTFMSHFDVILSPAMACLPPMLSTISLDQTGQDAQALNRKCTTFSRLYNWTGQPAVSVPLHITDNGIPVGLLFAGRFSEEALLLQLALELEAARPWCGLAPDYANLNR